jgi:chorismate-pyruvate lyase
MPIEMEPTMSAPPLDQILSSVKWLSVEEFLADRPAPPSSLWRTLLTTDGSTTTFLSALCRRRISLDVVSQQPVSLPRPLADGLGVAPGDRCLQRCVWLKDGNRPLALGYSLIALDGLSPELHDRLARQDSPIGWLAGELGLPSLRDRLQIGRLANPQLARQFSGPATELWSRRYRLRIPDQLTAVIIEVFSPHLESLHAS